MTSTKSKWYQFVPNAITSMNLVSGTLALFFAYEEKILIAILLLLLAALFDFLDGMAARLLKVSTKIGKELDSLADLVSFGLLPGVLVFVILRNLFHVQNYDFSGLANLELIILFLPILIPVASAIRLAKFNIDTRQSEEFIGMPVPANAIFWSALAYDYFIAANPVFMQLQTPFVFAILVVLCSILLNTEIRLLSLKFKNLNFKENAFRYALILAVIIFVSLFWLSGLALVIIFYILLSILRNQLSC